MKLPVLYDKLNPKQKREVRTEYIRLQEGNCYFCHEPLSGKPDKQVLDKDINLSLFPVGFLRWPIHLQHCHSSGFTEGAVHARCNAAMWQYLGR